MPDGASLTRLVGDLHHFVIPVRAGKGGVLLLSVGEGQRYKYGARSHTQRATAKEENQQDFPFMTECFVSARLHGNPILQRVNQECV